MLRTRDSVTLSPCGGWRARGQCLHLISIQSPSLNAKATVYFYKVWRHQRIYLKNPRTSETWPRGIMWRTTLLECFECNYLTLGTVWEGVKITLKSYILRQCCKTLLVSTAGALSRCFNVGMVMIVGKNIFYLFGEIIFRSVCKISK